MPASLSVRSALAFRPQVVDPLYVWRLVLVALLFLAAAGGGAAVLLLHFNERVLAKPLRRFGPT